MSFLKEKLTFLELEISSEGENLHKERIKAIQDYQSPKTIKQLRGFLGFIGYFRNHIKDYAEVAEPLFKILRIAPNKKKKKRFEAELLLGQGDSESF